MESAPTTLTTSLISASTDDDGTLTRQSVTTNTFTFEDVEDDHIYAMLSDDHDVVACCRLQNAYSKNSYDSIVRKIDRM